MVTLLIDTRFYRFLSALDFLKGEMLKDGRIVLDMEMIGIKVHMDTRNKELVHVIFMKKEEKMGQLFECYD